MAAASVPVSQKKKLNLLCGNIFSFGGTSLRARPLSSLPYLLFPAKVLETQY